MSPSKRVSWVGADGVDLNKISLDKPKAAHLDSQTYELKLLSPDAAPSSKDPPRPHSHHSALSKRASTFSQLPPVDQGSKAWGYLAGAFLVEAFVWGFPLSFGIFQNYMTTHEPFKGHGSISIIGTLCSGLAYLGTPFSMRIISRFPRYRTPMMYLGLGMCCVACLIGSFCTQIWQLILTQGVVYGIGASFLYVPTLSYMNEWFVRRRGLAYGIMFGGTGISGLVLPLMFEKLLSIAGYATTLRAWAALMVGLIAPSIYFFIRGRLPPSQVSISRKMDLTFFREPFFLFIAFSNLLQGLGFFIPSIYLPSYASDLSMPSLQSTLVLSLLNVTSVVGQIVLGAFADKWGSTKPLIWSTLIGACSVCFMWGFSKNFSALIMFSIVYGLSAGGYSVLLSRFALELALDDPNRQLAMYGVFAFERGIGNVIAGPISAALVGSHEVIDSYAIRKYSSMVIFTAVTMGASSLSAVGTCFSRPK